MFAWEGEGAKNTSWRNTWDDQVAPAKRAAKYYDSYVYGIENRTRLFYF